MNILIVTEQLPYPLDAGGRVAPYQLINQLRKTNRIRILSKIPAAQGLKDAEELSTVWKNVEIVPIASFSARPSKLRRLKLMVLRKAAALTKGIKARPVRIILKAFFGVFLSIPGDMTGYFLIMSGKARNCLKLLFTKDPAIFPVCGGMNDRITESLKSDPPDVIQFDYIEMGRYVPGASPVPSIFVLHDLYFVRYLAEYKMARGLLKKFRALVFWHGIRKYELSACRRATSCITMTESDKEVLQSHIPDKKIFVSPTCIDTAFYTRKRPYENPGRLVFVGHMGHFPNVDAMSYFLDGIFPMILEEMPSVKIHIVGNYGGINEVRPLLNRPGAEWTGFAEDTRPYLENSIFVAPVRLGRGIKIKVLEAMSMECPIVATSLAAEGLFAVNGEHMMIADDPGRFAKTVIDLLKDRNRCIALGKKAGELARKKFDYTVAAPAREEVYRKTIEIFKRGNGIKI